MVAALTTDPTIRRQVMANARELLQHDRRTPIAAIAHRAGVSRATLYRHFGSRQALLRAIDLEPPASARERVLAAAADLIGPRGLDGFTMEQVAEAAGVSRATVYRLVPSKAALFGELVRAYSPFDEILAVLERRWDDPPDVALPEVARAMARVGYPRIGLLRAVMGDVATANPDAVAGAEPMLPEVVGRLGGYLERQMAAGRIHRSHPILAIQLLLGPVAFHLLTRPLAERFFGLTTSVEEVAAEFARMALRGLAAHGARP
jgi:AcrR family transcriptional regulator